MDRPKPRAAQAREGGAATAPAPGPALGPGGLDRAAALRRDPGALAALWARPGARAVALAEGEPALGDRAAPALVRLPAAAVGGGPPDLFLGLEEGEGLWAAETGPAGDPGENEAADLRFALAGLPAADGEAAATARALAQWHARHGFCAACGAPTRVADAGWRRDCPACGAQHFPRTDPVVIMLVTRGEATLLGRGAGWPEGMYSCLAGFVEPGETVEAAVRREVLEESGIRVGAVAYLASQPWPWPASLMLGCHGEAESDAILRDPGELEDALWVGRERMARVLRGDDPAIRAPREGPIAGWLLRRWVAGALG